MSPHLQIGNKYSSSLYTLHSPSIDRSSPWLMHLNAFVRNKEDIPVRMSSRLLYDYQELFQLEVSGARANLQQHVAAAERSLQSSFVFVLHVVMHSIQPNISLT